MATVRWMLPDRSTGGPKKMLPGVEQPGALRPLKAPSPEMAVPMVDSQATSTG